MVMNSKKPIALVGMMGVGKTHLGHILAERLEQSFIDTDDLIEQKCGQRISDIFENEGEEYFRAKEAQLLTESIIQNPKAIIATGGGAVTTPESLELLVSNTHMVWLQATPEEIYARTQSKQTRPLLQTDDPLQTLRSLLQEREEFYARAHIHINVNAANVEGTIANLIKSLLERVNNDK